MKHFFSLLALVILFIQQAIFPQGVTYNRGPKLFDARTGHGGVVLSDGRVLITGGHGTQFVRLNSAEIWNPTTNAFTKYTMNDYRDYSAVVKLQDGRYLLAGGMSSDLGVGQLATMEIFNPVNNTFTPAANMTKVRTWFRGAQLTGGKVLLVGCWYDNVSGVTGDLYNPTTNTCVTTGDMTVARSNPYVLPMNDGSALVLGGNDPYGGYTFERIDMYNPTTNSFSIFQNKLLPMDTLWTPVLSSSDMAESYKMSNGKYIMLASKELFDRAIYKLFTIDPATKTIDTFAVNPPIPYYYYFGTSGDTTTHLSPLLDKTNNKLYIFSVKVVTMGEAFKVSTIDLTTHKLYTATGLKSIPYFFNDTPRLCLNDGRLFVAGGNATNNFDPVDSTFFLTLLPVGVKDGIPVPAEYTLSQNYPNPFNPSTSISYSVPERSEVTISVYSVLGELVTTLFKGSVEAGEHTVKFNAGKIASGTYIYQIRSGGSMISKKMLLLK